MFTELYASACILGLIIASYTDLKERRVPNKLNYSLLAIGLLLHAAESIIYKTPTPILFSASGAIIAFAFAMLLWRLGVWAGGDVKLFTAVGALVPLPLISAVPPFYNSFPIFPFLILINSVLLSIPFTVGFVLIRALSKRHRAKAKKLFSVACGKTVLSTLVIFSSSQLLQWFNLPQYFIIFLILPFIFIPHPTKYIIPFLLTLFFILSGALDQLFLFFVSLFVVALFFESMTKGRAFLRAEVKVSGLEPGMISSCTLYFDGIVKTFKPSLFNLFKEPPKVMVSCLSADGITQPQINELRRRGVKSIEIKESVPLVPLVLLGSIASILIGDLIWLAVQASSL